LTIIFFLFFSSLILNLNAFPVYFQNIHSICFSFRFDPYSFYYYFFILNNSWNWNFLSISSSFYFFHISNLIIVLFITIFYFQSFF
jgi:hypothetical protein